MNTNLLTDPHDIAAAALCHYSGDMKPLDKGGLWYESNNWVEHGHANAVRVTSQRWDDNCKYLIAHKLVVAKKKIVTLAIDSYNDSNNTKYTKDAPVNIQILASVKYGLYDKDCRTAFVIPDAGQPTEGFKKYCHKSYGDQMGTNDDVWKLLAVWVGQGLK